MLFFGCRKEEHDYIYRDEMEKALSENVISSLNVAFSRDDPKKKVYVQDKIQTLEIIIAFIVNKRRAIKETNLNYERNNDDEPKL